MVEVVVEANELFRLPSNGVHFGHHLTQVGMEHGEGHVRLHVRHHLHEDKGMKTGERT